MPPQITRVVVREVQDWRVEKTVSAQSRIAEAQRTKQDVGKGAIER